MGSICECLRHALSTLFNQNDYSLQRNTCKYTTNAERSKVSAETLSLLQQGFYRNSKGVQIYLDSGETLHQKSTYYPLSDQPIESAEARYDTHIEIVNKDCLDAAQEAVEKGNKAVVLNFAGPEEVGGGFIDGTNGQEENICYRSEIAGFMSFHLAEQNAKLGTGKPLVYPLYDKLLFTPDVLVFRKRREESYMLLDTPFRVGILTSAALVNPAVKQDGDKVIYELEKDRNKTEELIRNQLYIAHKNGFDSVILGAFGCGAFKNPPYEVAKLYQKLLTTTFKGAFKEIVFAILGDHGANLAHNPHGNLKPFEECFRNTCVYTSRTSRIGFWAADSGIYETFEPCKYF